MPVATMLAIAASFWSAHGHPATANVNWSWDYSFPGRYAAVTSVITIDGTRTAGIAFNRYSWDQMTNKQKCVIVIHEMGHAEFDFGHEMGTVMAPDASMYSVNVPGACIRSARAWREVARA